VKIVEKTLMTEPEGTCASCGGQLEQSGTGRPRAYCSAVCRRLAERKLRVAEQLLTRARKQEQDARRRAAGGFGGEVAAWWAAEVARCEAELAALLAAADSDGDDPSEAAAVLARQRRAR
jgi:hypothetical protein